MIRLLLLCMLSLLTAPAAALDDAVIAAEQARIAALPLPERIAYWADRFVGTPYDPDPLGLYVRKRAIVADERMDCMYHLFRSVELASSATPEEARGAALDLRFHHRGEIEGGLVTNYTDRFEYGEDMLRSGKWGRDITAELGPAYELPGTRGAGAHRVLMRGELRAAMPRLRSGDILFLVKAPQRRVRGEVVGHIGVLVGDAAGLHLVHASGVKGSGGAIRRVPLEDYLREMPFIGVMVARFD